MSVCFTICFDGQFWVGVLERLDAGGVRAVKVTFGAEPTDAELREWVLERGNDLFARLDAAQHAAAEAGARTRTRNPKRVQREAARAARRPRAGQRPVSRVGAGRGLQGVAERVRVFGGRFASGPAPDGGWRLHAAIPVRAAAREREQAGDGQEERDD